MVSGKHHRDPCSLRALRPQGSVLQGSSSGPRARGRVWAQGGRRRGASPRACLSCAVLTRWRQQVCILVRGGFVTYHFSVDDLLCRFWSFTFIIKTQRTFLFMYLDLFICLFFGFLF